MGNGFPQSVTGEGTEKGQKARSQGQTAGIEGTGGKVWKPSSTETFKTIGR